MRSRRFTAREGRELRRETLLRPDASLGLVAMDGPGDPLPSLVISGGAVVELDGKPLGRFDVIDHFVARHGIDLAVAEEAMALSAVELARRLVDVSVGRAEAVRLARGLTPAKLARVMCELDPVELMFALKKLRARRQPGNQAHVTNLKENPALLAADAAEASLRGFDEMETTVGVARYAPLNAIALLVGSQTGRAGSMTQCAIEESRNLQLALLGLVTYAETLSVYGTEAVFDDGDDSPWSKAFLASAYASRGVKVRFTSGGGSEALMGHSEGCSMLYLEARCLAVVRAAGSQGVQNGSISCIALELSLPGGTRAVLAENVLAAWLDLEVASGNDAIASHSEIRRTGKLMGQFLPGTDFVTSGYSVMPRRDNMFGGGNYDADDLDEWLTLQRDWQVDAGIEPAGDAEIDAVRRRAARAIQAVFAELGLPPVSEGEVEAAVVAHSSLDVPDRDREADVEAADRLLADGVTGADVALALDRRGFGEIAERVFAMQRQRVSADYLQTAAVIDEGGVVRSAVNDPNVYAGPGTGWRLTGEHWRRLQALPHEIDADSERASRASGPAFIVETAVAVPGGERDEVVIAIGPAFGDALRATIADVDHRDVLDALAEGIREAGARPRLVRIRRTSDVGRIAHDGAALSGSGIAIGLQSKGTAVIHRADLQPLDNLELFSMAPLYTLASYRAMGRNAARYAVGGSAAPVPTELDNFAREADRANGAAAPSRDRRDRARRCAARGRARGGLGVSTARSRPMLVPFLALLLAGLVYYGARGSIGNFVLPWERAYGASRGDVSLIATVSFLSIGLAQPIAGRLLETVAAWKLLALGLALGLVGYGGGAFAPNLASAVVLVGAVGGFGGGLAANSTLSVMVTQLFRERQGTMFGLIGAATAGGSLLLIPSSSGVIDGVSRRAGLLFLAGCLALAVVGVLLFLRSAGGGEAYTRPAQRTTVVGALHVRDFWLLAIPFFVCGITSTGITDPHLIPYMQGCHIGNGTASTIAAALAGFNVLGTLASGVLTDRFDPRKMLAVIYLVRGVTLLLLPLLRSTELLAAFAIVYGLADFSTVPPTTALTKASFRGGGWALVLGLLGTSHQIGSALGGALGGLLYDQTGGYGAFFLLSAGVCVVAAVLSLGIGRSQPRALVPAPA